MLPAPVVQRFLASGSVPTETSRNFYTNVLYKRLVQKSLLQINCLEEAEEPTLLRLVVGGTTAVSAAAAAAATAHVEVVRLVVVVRLLRHVVRRVGKGVRVVVVEVGLEGHVLDNVLADDRVYVAGGVVEGRVDRVDRVVDGVEGLVVHLLGVVGNVVGTLADRLHAVVDRVRRVLGGLGEVVDLVSRLVDGTASTAGDDRAGHRHKGGRTEAADHRSSGLGDSRGVVLHHLDRSVGEGGGVLLELRRRRRELRADRVKGLRNSLR